MVRSQVLLVVTLLVCALFGRDATAVTDIRFERWTVANSTIARDVVAPRDSSTEVRVTFDARATLADLDPTHGFRFALAERDGGGGDVLARIEAAPCGTRPDPGADLHVEATLRVHCDAQGRLHALDRVGWKVTWCAYPQQQLCLEQSDVAVALPSSSDPEDFELVLFDENDVAGSFGTPEDALRCRGAEPPGPFLIANSPESPESGFVGVYTDPEGTLCSGTVVPLVPFRWYVVAHLMGMTRCGITTMEFGIHGLPPGFFVNVVPNPNAFAVIGNLFQVGGLGFECERGASDAIVLYTLDGIANAGVQDALLEVGPGSPPSNPTFWPSMWVELCPMLSNSRRPWRGQRFIINPSPGNDCDTTVRVRQETWSAMKTLYRAPG